MNKHGIHTDLARIREILAKSLELQDLTSKEISVLTELRDEDVWDEVFDTARRVKEKVYGNRIVLFAPLYLSNECVNNCLYCGFRKGHISAIRKTLTVEEAVREASLLAQRGYKRLLLVASEHAKHVSIEYLEKVIDAVYSNADIRILHLNAAPTTVDNFKRLKVAGVGVYQCFQETYHIPSYRHLHPSGTKADYAWRLGVMDRAIEAGFEDVGMGVLLGLYDWRWDVGALLSHCRRLMSKYGFGPHTLSVPRLQAAEGTDIDLEKYRVSDSDLKKIVALFRLSLPYVGVVVSTREPSHLRDELLQMGASQISAGSRTSPWGYIEDRDTEQFSVGDMRSLDEVIGKITELGLMPSLCTACYREGRSGEHFRTLALKQSIKSYCRENALLSIKEYLEDCASDAVKEKVSKLLEDELDKSSNGLAEKMRLIERGKRDVHI